MKLSRLEILRRTCKYIVFLMKMIDYLKQEAKEREEQQQQHYEVQQLLQLQPDGQLLLQQHQEQQHPMEVTEAFLVPVAEVPGEPTITYTTEAIIIEL